MRPWLFYPPRVRHLRGQKRRRAALAEFLVVDRRAFALKCKPQLRRDADTSDATAAVAEVLNGKTFYARGAKMTGTMPNNGEVNGEISTVSGKCTIPMGFHDGAGGVTIAATEQAKLVPANIREGVTVLGVKGSMSGSEGMKPQAKSVTPTFEQQVVLPDKAYNCLSQVTVQAIPATYVDNAAGGQTLTIGG